MCIRDSDKSDSQVMCEYTVDAVNGRYETTNFREFPCIGKSDLKLMHTLAKAGPDHGKFLRMINVTCDIVAPIYWVAEHDTYKVATVRNSCSFMHTGVNKAFTKDDFSLEGFEMCIRDSTTVEISY